MLTAGLPKARGGQMPLCVPEDGGPPAKAEDASSLKTGCVALDVLLAAGKGATSAVARFETGTRAIGVQTSKG